MVIYIDLNDTELLFRNRYAHNGANNIWKLFKNHRKPNCVAGFYELCLKEPWDV